MGDARPAWVVLALAAFLLGATACQPGGGGGAASSAAPAATGQPPLPLTWLRGDLHTHSTYSTSIRIVGDPPAVLVSLADSLGLDFLSLTDHRTADGTLDPGFRSGRMVLIPGEEWGASRGHAGAQGISANIQDQVDTTLPPATWNGQVQAVLDEVHRLGGAFVANHPTRDPWTWDVRGLDAVEVWNSFWALHAVPDLTAAELRDAVGPSLTAAGHSPSAALLAGVGATGGGRAYQALRYYEELLSRGERVACVGGSDRHFLLFLGYPTTHVGVLSRDLGGVIEGIRAHRTYVTARPEGPEVEFAADADGDGVNEVSIGDEVPAGRPVNFTVRVTRTPGGRIELRRSGVTIAHCVATTDPVVLTVQDSPRPGDWYRADFYEPADTSIPGGRSLLTVALSPAWSQVDWGDASTYTSLLAALSSLPDVRLDASHGTFLPMFSFTAEQDRLLNADPRDPAWSVAAVTSAIYAGAAP